MKKIIISAIFILAINGFVFAQTPRAVIDTVKAIRLLESDKNDVQRILVNYALDDTDYEQHSQEFSDDYADIEVSYSSGKCFENADDDADDDKDAEMWNVAEWKVTRIRIVLDEPIKPEDSGFDLAKFKKEQDENYENFYLYNSRDLGIVFSADKDEIDKIVFYPPKGSSSRLCDAAGAKKKFSDDSDFYKDALKSKNYDINLSPSVTDLILSAGEITPVCADKKQAKNRAEKASKISVQTVAVDPENDVLSYIYEVSGGVIAGSGANVVWDLTGVKPGTYTITASADDGCGVCGETKTKTVFVRECTDAKTK